MPFWLSPPHNPVDAAAPSRGWHAPLLIVPEMDKVLLDQLITSALRGDGDLLPLIAIQTIIFRNAVAASTSAGCCIFSGSTLTRLGVREPQYP